METRRSIRRFLPGPMPREDLEEMLRLTSLAQVGGVPSEMQQRLIDTVRSVFEPQSRESRDQSSYGKSTNKKAPFSRQRRGLSSLKG